MIDLQYRETVRAVLAVNGVLVSDDVDDERLLDTLRTYLGVPPLAEAMLIAMKRTGAQTVYRDFVDEGVRVRFEARRLDDLPWPQSPQDGPDRVEMGSDNQTTVTIKEREEAPSLPAAPAPLALDYTPEGGTLVAGNPFLNADDGLDALESDDANRG